MEEDVGYGLTSIFDDNGSEVLNMSMHLHLPPLSYNFYSLLILLRPLSLFCTVGAELENSQIKWMHKNLIGTGPNGEVYAGINTITQTPIIIKEIVYESSSSAGGMLQNYS